MLVEYKPNVKWGLWVGLLLQASCGPLLAWRLQNMPDADAAVADVSNLVITALLLGGVYCWAAGCGDYARAKGHAGSLGSLLSLLSLLGLFILWVLPDRHPFDAFGPRRLVPQLVPAAVVATPAASVAPPPAPGTDPAESRWYYVSGEEMVGPLAEPAMVEMARSGHLKRADLVWKSGLQNWLPAESQFAAVYNRPAQPVAAEVVSPPPAPAPVVVAAATAATVAVSMAPVAVATTAVSTEPAPAVAAPMPARAPAPAAPIPTRAPTLAPAPAKIQRAELTAVSRAPARPVAKKPKRSNWALALFMPLAGLLVLGLTVLTLWPQYAQGLWPPAFLGSLLKTQSPAPAVTQPSAPVPAPQPQGAETAKPVPAPPAPAMPPPASAPLPPASSSLPASPALPPAAAPAASARPAGTVTGTYKRIDPPPVDNPKTHASSHAELLLQQLNPRLVQFDVRFEWTTTPHVHTMERELKGVAKLQGDSFAYDYINPIGVRPDGGGHCLEIRFQQDGARLIVPQDAPDPCIDASGMAGLYVRGTSG